MAGNFKKVIPMLDRILIRRADPITTSKGGVLLPEAAIRKMTEGTVIAVGNKANLKEKPALSIGDRVLLPEFGGTKVVMSDNKEYVLFREADILAKIE